MIDCPNAEVRELLPEFALGGEALAPERRARVEAHLATCPACREELELLAAVRRSSGQGHAVDVARVVAALPRPGQEGRAGRGGRPAIAGAGGHRGGPGSLRRSLTWQRVAAVALVTVGASSLWLARAGVFGDGPQVGDSSIIAELRAGESAALTLAHRLGDLTDQDLESLLGALEDLEALPAVDPAPVMTPFDGEEGS